ncbi:MAG: PQQ-binding-like beta-propeller repeat protein, partial [Acidobacteriota bacterium]
MIPDSFGLTSEWTAEAGAGYSGVSLTGGVLYTMFTSGESDFLGAFDADTGAEKWRLRLAEKYDGHDGSDDGPLAVPTLDGDQVFAFGPRGDLVAADLETGQEQWRLKLDESNSSVPFYGYTCSPLVVGDLVVMLVGGEGRAVVAYDRRTGEERWATGTDSVTYQSPIFAELGGREQILAVTDQWARGLDPSTGAELWSYRIQTGSEREIGSHPTILDAERVLIDLGGESLALQVMGQGEQWSVSEAWRSRAFANTFVLPEVHGSEIYGFTGQILTAADAATGEILWRSRAMSGENMTLVDGHLAVLTGDGELVVAEANPEEYVEKARLKVFERGDFSNPAFASGRLYLRSQAELASIRIDASKTGEVAPPEVDEFLHLGAFGEFIKSLDSLPEGERQAQVDGYFAAARSTPIVERDGSAHVVYRGEAADVALGGTAVGYVGEDLALHRVEGTDLFYRSLKLHPEGVYGYTLAVDFGPPGPDPSNPVEVRGFVRSSELRLPGARVNGALAEPSEDAPRGELYSFRFRSEVLENSRQIKVWTPPGFDEGAETPYPLLVVNYGLFAVDAGGLDRVLDNLTGSRVAPAVVALVPRNSPAEYTGDRASDYAKFLAEELVPYLDRHYRTGGPRAIMGPASAGVISLHAALAYPGLFDRVAVQS